MSDPTPSPATPAPATPAPVNPADTGVPIAPAAIVLPDTEAENAERMKFIQQAKAEADEMGLNAPDRSKYVKSCVEKRIQQLYEIQLFQVKQTHQAQPGNVMAPAPAREETSDARRRPPFNSFKNDSSMDRYLKSFENYCAMWKVPADQRGRELYPLLPQKFQHILDDMDTDMDQGNMPSYDVIKAALLKATNFSAEDCRARYIGALPKAEDGMATFLQRKWQLLADWLRLSKVPKEHDKVLEFIIWDSVQSLLPLDMVSHIRLNIKENISLDSISLEAEEYMKHSCPGKRLLDIIKKPPSSNQERKQVVLSENANNGQQKKHKKHPKRNGHRHQQESQPVNKEHCSADKSAIAPAKAGHPASSHSSGHQRSHNGNNSSHSQKPGMTTGNRPTQKFSHSYPAKKGAPLSTHSLHGIQAEVDLIASEEDLDGPHYDAPATLSSLSTSGKISAPHCTGLLNSEETQIVLDTGAEGIFVDRRLVKDEDLTGQYVWVRFAEGKPVRRSCCFVQLNCPYYNGKAPAIALEEPALPVYLGRMTNLEPYFDTEAYDLAIKEWDERKAHKVHSATASKGVHHKYDNDEDMEADDIALKSVSTRSTQRDNIPAPIPEGIPLDPLQNREQFAKEQKECPTLEKWRKNAEKNDVLSFRGRVVQYKLKDGLLYRSAALNGHQEEQLCIPRSLRRQAMYMAHHNPLSGH